MDLNKICIEAANESFTGFNGLDTEQVDQCFQTIHEKLTERPNIDVDGNAIML
jgi:hypothetical protein